MLQIFVFLFKKTYRINTSGEKGISRLVPGLREIERRVLIGPPALLLALLGGDNEFEEEVVVAGVDKSSSSSAAFGQTTCESS